MAAYSFENLVLRDILTMSNVLSVFFFQAEDGIRDRDVTGVQTCALPIFHQPRPRRGSGRMPAAPPAGTRRRPARGGRWAARDALPAGPRGPGRPPGAQGRQIGRASCRERVEISVVVAVLKKKSVTQRSSV